MHCFQRYIWIYDKFHRKEHPEMASAQLGFGIFVIHKAEMFPWDKCLRFAMDRLNLIRVSNVHDATLWEERPLDWIHQHFSYVPPPASRHPEAPAHQHFRHNWADAMSGCSLRWNLS
ncbi:hypothetical protein E4U19_006777 [Claviceps sp. Clav32 group G5]|nr:hypothetical protein E4U19_006777 [Claviceps sp. Clav32 group G5]